MSLDHVSVYVARDKIDAEVKFMEKAFAHVGIKELMRISPDVVGLGTQQPWYWLISCKKGGDAVSGEEFTGMTQHIGITVTNRDQVDEFYKAAIEFGAQDNGQPGIREHYHPNYYAAFVISPAGLNIEAVCHH